MHRSWFPVLGILILAGLAQAGCSPEALQGLVQQHIEESRAAVEGARAAGAPERSPEEFQAALRALRQGEAFLQAGGAENLSAADYYAAVATATAQSAMATARLSADLEEVKSGAREAKQDAGRALAEVDRMQPQLRAAEEAARETQTRAERAEDQMGGREQAPPAQPARPTSLSAYMRYVVKPGETLRQIAARPEIYGDPDRWQRIYDANRDIIGPDRKLKIGQVLMIPKP